MNAANPNNLRQVKAVGVNTDLLCIARVPGTQQLWAGGRDGKLYHIDFAMANPLPQSFAAHDSYVSGVVLTDRHIISAGWDKRISWWDLESKRHVRTIQAHQRWIRQLAMSPNKETVATVADDMVCRLWDANSGRLQRELRGHAEKIPVSHYPSKLYACAVSSDGRYVAAADFVGRVLVWEIASGNQVGSIEAPIFLNPRPYVLGWGGLRALAFSPDSNQLALAGMENTDPYITVGNSLVRVYNWRSAEQTHEFKAGRDFQFESVCFSQRGDWVAAASGGGRANLTFFDLAARRVIKDATPPSQIYGLALGDNSETLFGAGRHFVQWDLV